MLTMKKYLARLPVGAERDLILGGDCPGCGRPPGELHSFGCRMEECPKCHRILIGCNCSCLSPHDSAGLIKALHDEFAGLAEAVEVVSSTDAGQGGEESYLVHAAMQFLYENIPDQARAGLNRLFQEKHPGLIPQLQDDSGYGYYTAEQLAVALRIPIAEVHEKIEAMVAAGQGIRFGDGIRLHRVN
jgi:hypothetical protein